MLFFTAKPDLPDEHKARLEFRLQQIADGVGANAYTLPVRSCSHFGFDSPAANAASVLAVIGEHLNADFSGMKIENALDVVQKQASGGG